MAVTLEERDLFLAQLYEEKAETRELKKDINRFKMKQLQAAKAEAKNADTPDLQQSVESIKRLGFELTSLEQSPAVLDYKYLKDEIESMKVQSKPTFSNRRLKRPGSKSVGKYKAPAFHESKRYLDGESQFNKPDTARSLKQERDFLLYKLDELEQVKTNLRAELNGQRRLVSEL